MSRALVALGSNLGDRQATLDRAVAELAQGERLRVTGISSWFETAPVGGPAGQAAFLNGAVAIETSLEPGDLLARLRQVEALAGRARRQRWDARTLDLDLLLYDELVSDTPELVLPHPRLVYRRFVLEPAAQVAAAWVHPTSGWTIGQLGDHLRAAPPWVVVTGDPGSDPRRLITDLALRLPIVEAAPAAQSGGETAGTLESGPESGGPPGDWELEFPERCRRFWSWWGPARPTRLVVTPWAPKAPGNRAPQAEACLAEVTDDVLTHDGLAPAVSPAGPLLILWLGTGGSGAVTPRRLGARARLPAPVAVFDLAGEDAASWAAVVTEAQAALEATGRLTG